MKILWFCWFLKYFFVAMLPECVNVIDQFIGNLRKFEMSMCFPF